MRHILLVEPGYKNKYPPLGLMKIARYHKNKGDYVQFIKGIASGLKPEKKWDRIYISTLFTFFWKETIKTINFYKKFVETTEQIFVGGVSATLLRDELHETTGVSIVTGLLDFPGVLDVGDTTIIDHLVPDYDLLTQSDYSYGQENAYIGYATRGCPNSCSFCAVSKIEPIFHGYLPLKKQIRTLEDLYGPRRHLTLLDNNVLASPNFNQIIDDIIKLGFYKGAKLNGGLRYVDFNQGLDLNFLTPEKMGRLSEIPIKPLRIAFDHIELKERYVKCIHLAAEYGILNLSNYVLYNFEDTPEDFYERLRINVELNEKLGTKIYSFPMKYIPLNAKDRSYIGEHWNRRLLRGVQCILMATLGKVGLRLDFFEAAFGGNVKEFLEIAVMPEHYIIYREKYKNNEALSWRKAFNSLTLEDKEQLAYISSSSPIDFKTLKSRKLKKLLLPFSEKVKE